MTKQYPSDADLKKIAEWDVYDPFGLVEFIRPIWHYGDWGFKIKGGSKVKTLTLHTGGWSGNESTIAALQDNGFWTLYWDTSSRGGHYTFKIRMVRWSDD